MSILLRWTALILGLLMPIGSHAQDSKSGYAPSDPNSGPNISGYALIVDAKLTQEGTSINRGMVWRVFSDRPGNDGKLALIATKKGGSVSFNLPAGTYLVHAAFGRAGATKRINLASRDISEDFVLQAGGLQLNATSGGVAIRPRQLRFSIYELEQDEDGNRKLIALNVPAERVIRLNAGTYHVLSRYGTINATVRADLEVKAGEVTESILQHRAAPVTLKLVSSAGGDPVANTAWTILTQDGEKVFESTSVAPSLVLAEGTYEASVRNGAKAYRKSFAIKPGIAENVEILLN